MFSSVMSGAIEVTPGSATKQGCSSGPAAHMHSAVIGAIVVSVSMTCLLLFGIIFCLRRCVSRNSSSRTADTTRATSGVSSHPVSSQTTGRPEGGVTAQGQDSFLERNGAKRDSTLSIATVQEQSNSRGRYSQISITSSISRSIRFAITGSYNSTSSPVSRATVSMIAVDGAHTPGDEASGEPPSPWRPPSVHAPSPEYTASWRGTNLSNIINAARGIKS
jgi:hypothetical protein